jgi:hypothetical protein
MYTALYGGNYYVKNSLKYKCKTVLIWGGGCHCMTRISLQSGPMLDINGTPFPTSHRPHPFPMFGLFLPSAAHTFLL